jgi:hypothetical protein
MLYICARCQQLRLFVIVLYTCVLALSRTLQRHSTMLKHGRVHVIASDIIAAPNQASLLYSAALQLCHSGMLSISSE